MKRHFQGNFHLLAAAARSFASVGICFVAALVLLALATASQAPAAPPCDPVTGCPPQSEPPPPHVSLVATLLPRFGIDNDRNGIIDEPNSFAYAHPSRFVRRVELDACAVTPSNVTLTWSEPVISSGVTCRGYVDVDFSRSKTHSFTVTAQNGAGKASSSASVTFKGDLLITSLGDSYASGEGNPDKIVQRRFGFVTAGAQWADRRCHRSSNNAGPALAAKAVEDRDPTTTVTFIHLACSGAGIEPSSTAADAEKLNTGGLLTAYCGKEPCSINPADAVSPQITNLADITGGKRGRKIDALLISIGGNDLGFTSIIEECELVSFCFSHVDASGLTLNERIARRLNEILNVKLKHLASAITSDLNVEPHDVYVTEYPDPTFDSSGNWIAFPDALAGIDGVEAQWASQAVVGGLNRALRAAALANHWTFVSGVASQFFQRSVFGHGISAGENRWFNTPEDSVLMQDNIDGALHPNHFGQQAYANAILRALRIH